MSREMSDDCWALFWNVQVSVRYHMRRQAFFERWSRVTSATGVIFGSTAMAAAFSSLHVHPALIASTGALVTVASVVDLVVGTASMARKHEELKRKFIELQADIECHPSEAPEDMLAWNRRKLQIEMEEPPTYFALAVLCENEQGRATEDVGDRASLPWYVTLTANWFRWENQSAKPMPEGA